METNLFDYHLPSERIAQFSVEPRDQARLLCLKRESATWQDKHVFDLPDLLHAGDLLVFNDSKVFKARLRTQQQIELFLLRPTSNGTTWLALAKPARKLIVGSNVTLMNGDEITVNAKHADGTLEIDLHRSPADVFKLTDELGEIPIPPYVKQQPTRPEDYQTIYAKHLGSVAAPTAGFHFTPELLKRLDMIGISRAYVTLHVGLGTFRPMKNERLEQHEMHEEWVEVSTATAEAIRETKKRGHRVIAIGTTTARALESAAADGMVQPWSGYTRLFITPGYKFHVLDGLFTNFHLPKSTLLVLVSSFAGRETILRAYQHAIEHGYRFYSFGDAMLIE